MNSNIVIKILKGPYSDVWRDPIFDSKEFSDHLYDINMWDCDITWDCSASWLIAKSKDYRKWFDIYWDFKEKYPNINIIEMINNKIDLKQSVNPDTAKTFEELIDEL
jgi:hypothetical protein